MRRAFELDPPEDVVGDDLSWLDAIIRQTRGLDTDIKSLAAERIARRFRAFRTCHATRTADVASFYQDGLIPLAPQAVHARAAEIFLGGAFPELTAADLDKAITAVGSETREGRVYFEANEWLLLNLSSQYLLYGGEYLIAIAAHLPDDRDYRQILKGTGTPTLFICDVPLDLIDGRILRGFAGTALASLFEHLLDAEFEPGRHRGAGFPIHHRLPPEHIVGHYHPTRIRDPFPPRVR